MSAPTQKELFQLRELTRTTGQLTNVQSLQLSRWASVILLANQFEVTFNFEERTVVVSMSQIDYSLLPKEGTADNYNKRMSMYDKSVKFLLGDEYGVLIMMKNHPLGNFPPTTVPPQVHPPRFE